MVKYVLSIPIIFYIAASLWANFDLFPKDFMQYWWFDDVGHIVVFGSLTLVALTFAHSKQIPSAAAVSSIVILAIADELSQLFLIYRAFTYHDLVMSLTGIALVYIGYLVLRQRYQVNI